MSMAKPTPDYQDILRRLKLLLGAAAAIDDEVNELVLVRLEERFASADALAIWHAVEPVLDHANLLGDLEDAIDGLQALIAGADGVDA